MNRELKTIIIVIGSGLLLLGGLFGYEHIQAGETEVAEPMEPASTDVDPEDAVNLALEARIDSLQLESIDLEKFPELMTEIHSYYVNEAYTASIKQSLENKLIDTYATLIFKKAETFLRLERGNSQQVLRYLAFAEKNGAPAKKVNYYKGQIWWHNYYAYTLPAKVNNFISAGITNYSDEEYEEFKNEITEMPNLEKRFQTSKFSDLRKELIHNLGEFNLAFYLPDYEPEYMNL